MQILDREFSGVTQLHRQSPHAELLRGFFVVPLHPQPIFPFINPPPDDASPPASNSNSPSDLADRVIYSTAKMSVLSVILKVYVGVPLVMLSSSLAGFLSPIPSVRFWSRAIACYCSVLICASYGVIASILLRIIGRPTLSQWTTGRVFAGITCPLIGWEWDVQGEEILRENRPAVFISNHQR